jgi:hypothetical protein
MNSPSSLLLTLQPLGHEYLDILSRCRTDDRIDWLKAKYSILHQFTSNSGIGEGNGLLASVCRTWMRWLSDAIRHMHLVIAVLLITRSKTIAFGCIATGLIMAKRLCNKYKISFLELLIFLSYSPW